MTDIPEEPIERAIEAFTRGYGMVDSMRAALEASGLFAAGRIAGLLEAENVVVCSYCAAAVADRIAELQREDAG